MSSRVLITGAAGFLGSHLCDYYLGKGYEVLGIDNLSTGSRQNISHLSGNGHFSFYEVDIVEPLPGKVTQEPFDIILNMASPASPPHYQRLGIETLRVGSEGTLRMLELARHHGARFFHASTSEVYGDPEVHPQPETYRGSVNSYGPRSMYDEAKRYAEALVYTHRKKYGTNTCVGRFFNTYGPRMSADDGRVVSNFIVQALKGESLTLYGDGSQTRSFCYVDDLVEAIARLVDSDQEGPINLGNPGEFTIRELAGLVLAKTGAKSKLTYLPLPGDDPTQRKPVIELAKERLGWAPTIPLEQGLDKTIEYFKTSLGSAA
ncbi:MAG TPA: UDP-glucuronic acid decarboxylase family protein [Candidatus Saccharimonadales bacterium]|nr:UDP-glucuronic acid decarboxylase family protein [Candidatus Saccharimonadales bacterium]